VYTKYVKERLKNEKKHKPNVKSHPACAGLQPVCCLLYDARHGLQLTPSILRIPRQQEAIQKKRVNTYLVYTLFQ